MSKLKRKTPVVVANDRHEVKIYATENRGRTLYQLSYHRGGQRERRSFSDLAEAKREAGLILNTLAQEAAHVVNLGSADIQSYAAARRALDPLGIPVHVAAETYAAAHRILGGKVSVANAAEYWASRNHGVESKTLWAVTEEFVENRRNAGVCQGYISGLRSTLGRLAKHLGEKRLPNVQTSDLDEWLCGLPFGPVTRNNMRLRLVTFSKWAKQHGYLHPSSHVFQGMMDFKVVPKDVEVFTPDEMSRILAAAGRHLVTPMLVIGAFAGLRNAEICRLDWTDIKLEVGLIEVRAGNAKTRARRLVPISENLREWLRPFMLPSGKVLTHLRPDAALIKIATRAGVEWRKNALRHSFVSYRLMQTNDPAKTALEAGHDQMILFRHYRALVTADMAAKWFAIMPPIEIQRGLVGMRVGNIGKHRDTPWKRASAQMHAETAA